MDEFYIVEMIKNFHLEFSQGFIIDYNRTVSDNLQLLTAFIASNQVMKEMSIRN